MYPATFTSQGQISIPVPVRKSLDLFAGKKAIVSEVNGKVIIEPVLDFLDLAGAYKTNKKPLTNSQLHEAFGRVLAFRKSRPKVTK